MHACTTVLNHRKITLNISQHPDRSMHFYDIPQFAVFGTSTLKAYPACRPACVQLLRFNVAICCSVGGLKKGLVVELANGSNAMVLEVTGASTISVCTSAKACVRMPAATACNVILVLGLGGRQREAFASSS